MPRNQQRLRQRSRLRTCPTTLLRSARANRAISASVVPGTSSLTTGTAAARRGLACIPCRRCHGRSPVIDQNTSAPKLRSWLLPGACTNGGWNPGATNCLTCFGLFDACSSRVNNDHSREGVSINRATGGRVQQVVCCISLGRLRRSCHRMTGSLPLLLLSQIIDLPLDAELGTTRPAAG